MPAFRAALLLLLCALPTLAQDLPAPPAELERFAPLLGRWEGKGTFKMGPEEPDLPWTSVTLVEKVMNGHFYQERMRVELGDFGSMAFVSFYGYDAHLGQHHAFTVTNKGSINVQRIHWIGENTMLTMSSMVEEGNPALERWTTQIGKNEMTMVGEMAGADTPLFSHVRGKSVRKDGPAPDLNVPAMMGAAPSPEMTALLRMAGRYAIDGSYRMGPDQEMTPFQGSETITPMFGGVVLASQSQGDGYEGRAFFVWDGAKKAFDMVEVNNWGMFGRSSGWIMDNTFVAQASTVFLGTPMQTRHVIRLSADGKPTSCDGHTLQGPAAPYHAMSCKYAPAKSN